MSFDPDTYGSEISPGAGCGPDLYDTEPAFAALLDSCEELLPERFSEFDRSEIEFTDIFKQMDGFLKQSRDLRLLILLAQFGILAGQLHTFANAVRIMRRLLENHWDEVHPMDADFGHMERIGALEALNNRPAVVLPLEAAPLLKTRRTGPISYRAIQIAAGDTTARPDEHTISLGAIEAALTSGELEQDAIDEVLTDLADLPDELEAISSVCTEKLKAADAKAAPPNYEALSILLRQMNTELNTRLGRIAPEDAEDSDGDTQADTGAGAADTSPAEQQDIRNAAQAKLILDAVEDYFASREPSHPALFLVREARGLVGKSYLDALKILMPRRFDDVALLLGTSGLQLSNDRLIDLNENDDPDLGDIDGFSVLVIENRSDAMKGIGAVKGYYSTNEPTSPIPLLLEEAQNMSSGSFTGLLNLFLRPEGD
ncbi:ImpA family type VI secretion system protein [Roseibium sediminicola]|uniref:Type VI secretion system ImpA family N-terminal domain-containing protein n=1 Tax=Roseibium sediminicola TaxID=2933272 RepID=A0ABT0GRW9_9HYPH|nr:type VI secretion system ImpA family N-terminal domain-containing protein [Roseibium sp. CAU 1639]MCK7612026.1 type VI secretion system ImpA family N-terminal domain-containing protein [Roseibium sp. CAU 1639]